MSKITTKETSDFSKRLNLIIDFINQGIDGKSSVFVTEKGSFLSPLAVKETIEEARKEERKDTLREILWDVLENGSADRQWVIKHIQKKEYELSSIK